MSLTAEQIKDYEVTILWGVRKETPKNIELKFDKRIHLIKMKHFCGALKTVLNPLAYYEVRHHINIIRPDIIHMHSSASGFVGRWALIGLWFCRALGTHRQYCTMLLYSSRLFFLNAEWRNS